MSSSPARQKRGSSNASIDTKKTYESSSDMNEHSPGIIRSSQPPSDHSLRAGQTAVTEIARPTTVRNDTSEHIQLSNIYRMLSDFKWSNASDILQASMGIVSTVLFIISTYNIEGYHNSIEYVQLIFTCAYVLDFLGNILVTGLPYLLSRWSIIDFLTILPLWWNLYNLGYLSNASSGFITFVDDGTPVWQFLTLCRFLRIYKPLQIAELRRLTFWSDNALSRGLWSLVATVTIIVILGAGLIYIIETEQSDGTQMLFHDAIYFLVVTISTVGYGDITPSTAAGRMTVVLIILTAIVLIPLSTSDFVSSLTEYNKYGHPYTAPKPHIILCPPNDISWDDLSTTLNEFFHNSHNADVVYHVVILCNGGEEHRRNILFQCKTLPFWSEISYIVGSPASVDDLNKAKVNTAQAIFLTTGLRSYDYEAEMAQDEATLARAVSIKHLVPEVPVILHLLSPRNKSHVLWYQLSKFQNIQVICLNEVKLKVFATACICPGALGLISNLLSSYDGKQSLRSIFSKSATEATSSQAFSSQSLDDTHKTNKSIPVGITTDNNNNNNNGNNTTTTTTVPTTHHYKVHPFTALDLSKASMASEGLYRPWQEEYLYGFGHEMYTAQLPYYLNGLSFIEAAALIYETTQVILIALYRKDKHTGRIRVMLNPGSVVTLRCVDDDENSDVGCVIARSNLHAKSIVVVGEQVMEVKRRWRQDDIIKDEQQQRHDNSPNNNNNSRGIHNFNNKKHYRSQSILGTKADGQTKAATKIDADRPGSSVSNKERADGDHRTLAVDSDEHDHDKGADSGEDNLRSPSEISFMANGMKIDPLSYNAGSPRTDNSSPKAIVTPGTAKAEKSTANASDEVEGEQKDGAIASSTGEGVTRPAATDADQVRPNQMAMSAAPNSPVRSSKDHLNNRLSASTASQQPTTSSCAKAESHETPSNTTTSRSLADSDPFTNHIVICGFIDTRIINFLKRFRESDTRKVSFSL